MGENLNTNVVSSFLEFQRTKLFQQDTFQPK